MQQQSWKCEFEQSQQELSLSNSLVVSVYGCQHKKQADESILVIIKVMNLYIRIKLNINMIKLLEIGSN